MHVSSDSMLKAPSHCVGQATQPDYYKSYREVAL